MINIILFLIALGILIFVHELGHFLVAKKLKVPVEEFAIGFPPRLFRRKIGETVYSLNLIFLGGYVKLRGETDVNDPEGFLNKSSWIKILVVLAGVFFNFILAYLFFSFGYLIGLPEYSSEAKNVVILQVLPNSIAEKFGLKMLDKLVYLKYQNEIIYFTDAREVRKIIENYRGKEIILGVERSKKILELKIIPEPDKKKTPLGINLSNLDLVKYNFPLNFYFGFIKTKNTFFNLILGLKEFFGKILQGKKEALNDVVGPLGMFDIYNQFLALGFNYLLYFLAIISLNLVIINILPFPALDGGRFVFYLYEFLTNKKISANIENIVNIIGFVFLLILMIFITIKDIFVKFFK